MMEILRISQTTLHLPKQVQKSVRQSVGKKNEKLFANSLETCSNFFGMMAMLILVIILWDLFLGRGKNSKGELRSYHQP